MAPGFESTNAVRRVNDAAGEAVNVVRTSDLHEAFDLVSLALVSAGEPVDWDVASTRAGELAEKRALLR